MALICCRRDDGQERNFEVHLVVNHREFEGPYQMQDDENAAKQKEFFTAIQSINVKGIQSLAEDEGFEMKSAKEYPSKKEAFHFLAEIENDVLTPELEENVKEMFDILLKKGCQINATDRFGNRPLMLAAEKGNIAVATLLLNNGAGTEKTNDDKNSPLHWASKNGQLQATELLLQRKAKINAQNKNYETPLHLAVVEHKKDVVQYLIRKGADTQLVDLKERTPVQYSRSKSMENLFKKPNSGPGNKKVKSPYQSKYEAFAESESAKYHQEFQDLYRDIDLEKVDPSVAADREIPFSQNLNLKKHSMEALPTDDVKKCRYFCRQLKKINRKDIIKELRRRIPAGMTGPLADGNQLLFTYMDYSTRKELTRSLYKNEMWKRLANKLGIPSSQLDFYGDQQDAAEAILQERETDLTVGELYDALFDSDAGGFADEYL